MISDTGILIMVCGGMLAISIVGSLIAYMLVHRAEKIFKQAETDLKAMRHLRDILLDERGYTSNE